MLKGGRFIYIKKKKVSTSAPFGQCKLCLKHGILSTNDKGSSFEIGALTLAADLVSGVEQTDTGHGVVQRDVNLLPHRVTVGSWKKKKQHNEGEQWQIVDIFLLTWSIISCYLWVTFLVLNSHDNIMACLAKQI